MTSRQRVLATATALGLCLLLATPALAHGGNFKAPAGPGGPSPAAPGAPVPGWIGPQTPPSFPTPPPSGRLARATTWTPCAWDVWWQLNVESHLPAWGHNAPHGVLTESESVYRVGRAAVGRDEPVRDRRVERGATQFALPYLLSRIDRTEDVPPGMVSTALIAVARIAREDPPIRLFRTWAADRRASVEERESAVLALGLLRRTDPSRQPGAEALGGVRDFLLTMFDDDRTPMRVRAFAVLSLSLLADQPWGDCAIEKDGRLITRALWRRLEKKYASQELTIALFTALGHQPPEGVPDAIRERLKQIALGRPVFRRAWDAMERSHALSALARLGGPGCDLTLRNVLRMNRIPDAVQSAALIGLAQRAPAMSSEERVDTVRALRTALNSDRHWQVRGLGQLTFGILLGADLRLGHHGVLDETDVLRHLDHQARKGSTNTRPFSALGLGLAAYQVPSHSRPIAAALRGIRKTLIWGLRYARGSDTVVGAYAVGAGLARADDARPLLLEILRDVNRNFMLRGHCALALGQLGRSSEEVTSALLEATRERVSAFIQTQAVRALSLLDIPDIRQELVAQLAGKKSSRPAIGIVAASLGRVRDPAAVSQLLELARDGKASLYVRVAAVMALGLTFDPEPRPSRVRLTSHANYPSLTWSLQQVFNIM